jgi:NDP-sugar pyrophosphorylase family protein
MRFPPARPQSKVLVQVAGQPFLAYVLRLVETYNFRSVVLLTGHYADQIHHFVHEYRYDRAPIRVIDGGTQGTAAALWRARASLSEPFFFLDGNVLCQPGLIAQIAAAHAIHRAPIVVALSPRDRAPQHPQAQVVANAITHVSIFPDRAPVDPMTQTNQYVVGACGFDPSVFDRFPDMASFPDMSYFLRHAASEDRRLVQPVRYDGEWFAIHDPRDLQTLEGRDRARFNHLVREIDQRARCGSGPNVGIDRPRGLRPA